jgi:hypothetical protein
MMLEVANRQPGLFPHDNATPLSPASGCKNKNLWFDPEPRHRTHHVIPCPFNPLPEICRRNSSEPVALVDTQDWSKLVAFGRKTAIFCHFLRPPAGTPTLHSCGASPRKEIS